jgi:orotidine-5'-phosphate decarboxylase
MKAVEKYNKRADAADSLLCIGLDSDPTQIPERFRYEQDPQFAFNRWIIEQTHPYTAAYKLNAAFYEAEGTQGWGAMRATEVYLRQEHPDILRICDAKRGDVESTNAAYAKAIFDQMGFDAVTVHPYLGRTALYPFLERADKGIIILCRTSNAGAGEIQDLTIGDKPLWQVIAEKVSGEWNEHQNCMLVVGATYPDELRQIRAIVGDMTFLVPGVGTQGGDIHQVVQAGLNSTGKGLIISASRAIIFADDPGDAARTVRDQINLSVKNTAV